MRARCLASVLVLLAAPVLARDPARVAPESAPSSAAVAPAGEPGQRLEVRGVVYASGWPDARCARASVYVYQTDARGHYRPDDAMGNRDPRLKALLRTDGAGRYSFSTIRPGSYPGTRVPQHIHYEVAADGHGLAHLRDRLRGRPSHDRRGPAPGGAAGLDLLAEARSRRDRPGRASSSRTSCSAPSDPAIRRTSHDRGPRAGSLLAAWPGPPTRGSGRPSAARVRPGWPTARACPSTGTCARGATCASRQTSPASATRARWCGATASS